MGANRWAFDVNAIIRSPALRAMSSNAGTSLARTQHLKLLALPQDVQEDIFSRLSPPSLLEFACTCRVGLSIFQSKSLWLKACERCYLVNNGSSSEFEDLWKLRNVEFSGPHPHKSKGHPGFSKVVIGRGLRSLGDTPYALSFVYPLLNVSGLKCVFETSVVPPLGYILTLTHGAGPKFISDPILEDRRANTRFYVNDNPLLTISLEVQDLKQDCYVLPASHLKVGENELRWKYQCSADAYYMIQSIKLEAKCRQSLVRSLA